MRVLLAGVLFAASLLAQSIDPVEVKGELKWFALTEYPEAVRKVLGEPRLVAEFGTDNLSWQYQIGIGDVHEFSHQLVFRKSTGTLVSVTRNFEEPRSVDAWFPEQETSAYFWPNATKPQYSIRLRRLNDGRLLLAMGVSKPGQPTNQILLIRESELEIFYPWLKEQLSAAR